MTLQIVIPGTFSSPGLPELDVRGFADTFTRADASSLGYTERPKREWSLQPNDPALFTGGILSGQAFLKRTSTAGPAYAVAESNLSDAFLDVVLASIGAGTQREFGAVFRFTSPNNMWRLISRDKSEYRLVKYAGGTATVVWTSSGITPTNGDRLRVAMDGPNMFIHINGQQVHQLTDSMNQQATMHGWYGNTTGNSDRIDNIALTPFA